MSNKADKKLSNNSRPSSDENSAKIAFWKKNKTAKRFSRKANKSGKQTKASSMKRTNIFTSVAKFFKDSANEVKKIVWPTPRATFNNMLVVLVVVFIVGLFVFALDAGLLAVLGKFMGIASS